jgi:cellulose biosynthesis protein BcsE
MQSPGFYWINSSRKIEADLICQQIIKGLSKESRAVLIACGDTPEPLVAHLTDVALNKLPLFTIPEKKEAFFHLSSDLLRSLNVTKRIIMIHVNACLWQQFTTEEIKTWIKSTRDWLDEHEICLVILCYGLGTNLLKTQLTPVHRLLDGLTDLHWLEDCVQYSVSWWGTNNSLCGKTVLMLENDEGTLTQSDRINQERPISLNDDSLCLSEHIIFAGMEPPSENWHFFENNEQLVQSAKHTQAATVIFSLCSSDSVERLAQQIHDLRISCGTALKLIIREMSSDIRNNDEALLQACGANLILPATVSLSQVMMMIDGVQNQIFTRYVPEHFNTILKTTRSIRFKGILSPNEFSESVLSYMSNTVLPDDTKGVLIALSPVEGLNAEQALTLCDLRRVGDIASVANGRVYLFLSSCRINNLNTALGFILRLPVNEAFSRHEVWHKSSQITQEIKHLNAPLLKSKRKKTAPSIPIPTVELNERKMRNELRRNPLPLTLLIDADKGVL